MKIDWLKILLDN